MSIRELLHLPAVEKHAGPPDFTGEGELQRGIAVVFTVNIIWALLPIYWKQVAHIPATEVVCHRSFWGFFLVLFLLWLRGGLSEIGDICRNRRTLLFMIGCSFSHMFGWGFYIWAVGSGRILDAALGSYMLPVLNVFSGFIFFRERPRRLQWVSIALAACGVSGMIAVFGSIPWVGLVSACNSVLFAALRKNAPVNAMPGLVLELLISAPFLWGYLAYLTVTGQGMFLSLSVSQDLWLIGAGIVTIIPQMGYAYALCRVPLTTISLMQYIPPTGNFLVGIFLFNESFGADKIFGFLFIWAGLIIFTLEGFLFRKMIKTAATGRKEG
ncbi:MAG: EamA family transporter RarD [Deltaproteobacteria bacterium]|nr:EamA family transporter RarD [Deltaproteobacteria bacterium]